MSKNPDDRKPTNRNKAALVDQLFSLVVWAIIRFYKTLEEEIVEDHPEEALRLSIRQFRLAQQFSSAYRKERLEKENLC